MHRHLTVFAGSWKFAFRAKSEFLAVLFLVVVASSGCSKQQAAPAPRVTAIPVVVAKVTQKAMPVQLTAIGNVGSYSVSIRAQVAGELLEVHFREGDFVHKGQLLFTIDPRPYEAALAQAQATLLRDKAVAANSRGQAQRFSKLLADGSYHRRMRTLPRARLTQPRHRSLPMRRPSVQRS